LNDHVSNEGEKGRSRDRNKSRRNPEEYNPGSPAARLASKEKHNKKTTGEQPNDWRSHLPDNNAEAGCRLFIEMVDIDDTNSGPNNARTKPAAALSAAWK
jgi:hypothetical protein